MRAQLINHLFGKTSGFRTERLLQNDVLSEKINQRIHELSPENVAIWKKYV